MVFTILFIKLEPYRSQACGYVQTAAQLSLLFSYVTGIMLTVYKDLEQGAQNAIGLLVILVNISAFVVLLAFLISFAGKSVRDHEEATLTLPDGLTSVRISPQRDAYSVFLSHVWKHAQDQCADIKQRLLVMCPTMRIFLDVDDLENISDLEQYVDRSTVVCIFLTDGYISSANCRRELKQAVQRDKQLVVLLETDSNHGATTLPKLQAELSELRDESEREACQYLIDHVGAGSALQWHRESYLKHEVLRSVLSAIAGAQVEVHSPNARGARAQSHKALKAFVSDLYQTIPVPASDSWLRTPTPSGTGRHDASVQCSLAFVSHADAGHLPTVPVRRVSIGDREKHTDARPSPASIEGCTMHEELRDVLTTEFKLACVHGTDPESEAWDLAVVMLAPGVFSKPGVVQLFQTLLGQRRPLLTLYSTAVPFKFYMDSCPEELQRCGLCACASENEEMAGHEGTPRLGVA